MQAVDGTYFDEFGFMHECHAGPFRGGDLHVLVTSGSDRFPTVKTVGYFHTDRFPGEEGNCSAFIGLRVVVFLHPGTGVER
jgi:hypothetical protein